MYTLGQAAKEAGCSKATISRAIKNGKLSANKNDDNTYAIDAAELMRWIDSNGRINGQSKRNKTPSETPETPLENSGLRAEVDGLRAQVDLLKSERDHLREKLGAESEERRKLTAMLTDQRPTAPVMPQNGTSAHWGYWMALIAVLVILGALWLSQGGLLQSLS